MREKNPTFDVKVLSGSSSACQWAHAFALCRLEVLAMPTCVGSASSAGNSNGPVKQAGLPTSGTGCWKVLCCGAVLHAVGRAEVSWLPPAAPPPHT